ncbi:MAG: uracil-DNA glycosylase [Proteobacteria bacterium]|nr:uracil-DNA glycosylase [Pseudomonadota bacterium]MBI3499905.1 uracil-DNA glycosylase [Pseudomonadota bacterium]
MDAEAPARDCPLCPRLAEFRQTQRQHHPDWHNAPVASFGAGTARLLIVGLAPGLKGANRTGRPFTGDYAGELLYPMLIRHGFARGDYAARPDDGLELVDCRITNAVRCVPPANKPTPAEATICRRFLIAEMAAMPRLEAVLALGAIAHGAVLKASGERLAAHPFRHGALYRLKRPHWLADSYHCSRYNTNTGRLTEAMFAEVLAQLKATLDRAPGRPEQSAIE